MALYDKYIQWNIRVPFLIYSCDGCGPIAKAQYIQDPIIMEHQTLQPEYNHINFPKFVSILREGRIPYNQ